ncbi:MAG: hypothetical protein EOO88_37860 [Pedobacter sp.]|nr:MAG: hypothetical protein EOO88_37860 [Pedobacter sp.]
MSKIYLSVCLLFLATSSLKAQDENLSNSFTYKVVATQLSFPWEVLYGPDDSLWVTESRDYKITKIHPGNGGKRTILNLGARKNFAHYVDGSNNHYARIAGVDHPWPQGGLEGMVLHPQFLTGKPYLYVIYVRSWDSAKANKAGEFYTSRIERYTYNLTTKTLGSPTTIIDTIPGSSDHNSGRLTIGPDMKLYASVGDMGAGQFGNKNRKNYAQNLDAYQGKVLRFNLEEDADVATGGDPLKRWIPNDNPYINSTNGNRSAVYSFGHRNVQGLVWAHFNSGDSLIVNEHGPQTDDELNLVSKARNYGHPLVNGFCDGNMNGISNGPFTPGATGSATSEQNACTNFNLKEPISTYGTTDLTPATDPEGSNATWPTVGPSSVDFYQASKYTSNIPNWGNSVLITTLRAGRVIRVKMKADGSGIQTPVEQVEYFRGANNRFRDLAISPSGTKIYVAVDSAVQTSGPTTGVGSGTLPNFPGSILEFTYFQTLLSLDSVPVAVYADRKDFVIYPNPVVDKLTVVGKRNVVANQIG